MKIFKYFIALVAIMTVSMAFTSCSKDKDPDVDAKAYYLIDFVISDKGSLTDDEADAWTTKVSDTFYKGSTDRYPMYVTYDYAASNFNTIAAKGADSQLQKAIDEFATATGKKDFTVVMVLNEYEVTNDKNMDATFTKKNVDLLTKVWYPTK